MNRRIANLIFILALLIVFAGCRTVPEEVQLPEFYNIPTDITIIQGEAIDLLDLGMTATDSTGVEITDNISVDIQDVSILDPGTYTITYTVVDGNESTNQVTIQLTVFEEEISPPMLSHIPEEIEILHGQSIDLLDLGVTAYDYKDGDLTDQIEVNFVNTGYLGVGDYIVVYSITNSEGETTKDFTSLTVLDVNAYHPYFEDEPIDRVIIQGTYIDLLDLGLKAYDDKNGNLTGYIEIDITNTANLEVGEHIATYSITDSDDNTTYKQISITVIDSEYTYQLYNYGIQINGHTGGHITDLVVPETLHGKPVLSIGPYAFSNLGLYTISLPNRLGVIQHKAFRNNNITEVVLPNSMLSLFDESFADNDISVITIPKSVSTIEIDAFQDNPLLTYEVSEENDHYSGIDGVLFNKDGTILIQYPYGRSNELYQVPDQVTAIDYRAFYRADISGVLLNSNLERIGIDAFKDSTLSEVNFPSSISTIKRSAFENCQLESLVIPDTITIIEKKAFYNNQLTDVVIGEGLTIIYAEVFAYNLLSDITIPNGITAIDIEAFNSNHLTSVTIPESVKSIATGAFNNNDLSDVTFSEGLQVIYPEAFSANNITSVTLPATLAFLDNSAFNDNPIVAYNVADGGLYYSSIDGVLFNGDGTELHLYPTEKLDTNYVIPTSVTYIKPYAFSSEYLTSISMSDSVTYIGDSAFTSLKLTNVSLSNSLEYIGDHAFYGNNLSQVVIPDSVTYIGNYAFSYNQLDVVTMSENIQTIGHYAFEFNLIESIYLPEGLTSIGDGAFIGNRLSSVSIPSSLTIISDSAFSFNNIETLTLLEGLVEIRDRAFEFNLLSEVVLPESLTHIGVRAFRFNDITNIHIPINVSTMGEQSFYGNQITNYTYDGDLDWLLEPNVFMGNPLVEYHIEVDHTDFTVLDGVLYNKDVTILYHYPGGKIDTSFVVPDTVVEISSFAFYDSNLDEITIGENLEYFQDTILLELQLNSYHVVPTNPFYSSIDGVLFNKDQTELIRYPIAKSGETYTIPSTVTYIHPDAFSATSVEEVIIPTGMTEISDYSFAGSNISSVIIPNTVEIIGAAAFWGCNITEIIIPESVVEIRGWAFEGNPVETVLIEGDITRFNDIPYYYNLGMFHSELPRIVYPNYIYETAVYTIIQGETIDLLDIGIKAYDYIDGEISSNIIVEDIDTSTLAPDTYWIQYSVTDSDDNTVTFEYRLTVIEDVFEYTIANNEITITGYSDTGPDVVLIPGNIHGIPVTTIAPNAFQSKGITYVGIPSSVTSIGSNAFADNPIKHFYSDYGIFNWRESWYDIGLEYRIMNIYFRPWF